MKHDPPLLLVLLLLLLLPISILADEHTHYYQPKEQVIVWANSVSPLINTAEQYPFLSLPYCTGNNTLINHKHDSLSEALLGLNLVNLGTSIEFMRTTTLPVSLCTSVLNANQITQFVSAIQQEFRFSLIVDVLPVHGWVGQQSVEEAYSLFTHLEFQISHSLDQIIHVNLTNKNPVAISSSTLAPLSINFTYSANFVPTNITFDRRFDKYLDTPFFEHHVHWYSILNSFLLCALLLGTVAFVLIRALRRDLQRYDNMDIFDLDHDFEFDYGWKQIHGDVFRAPPNLPLLASLIGNGVQLFLFTLSALLFAFASASYQDVSITAGIVIYALLAVVNGFVGTGYYAKYGGSHWLKQAVTTSLIVPGTFGCIQLLVNTMALLYGSNRYIGFKTVLAMMAIFLLSVLPLTVVGGFIGYKTYTSSKYHHHQSLIQMHGFPTRVNPIPRPIPERTWHTSPWTLVVSGGVLPFVSAYMELYFVLTSAVALKVYYVYGFALLTALLLALNAACCTILVAYLLINAEDHRWHWVAFNAAGSTALYMFMYATYFYFAHTQMHGLFQSTFYFGYALMGCLFAYLTLGTIGHFSAGKFMHYIYANVKID